MSSIPFKVTSRLRNPKRPAWGQTGGYHSSRAAESKALGVMQEIESMYGLAPSAASLELYGEDGGDYMPSRRSGPEPIDPGESIGPLRVDPSAIRAAQRAGLSGLGSCCGGLGLSDSEKTYATVAAVGLGAYLLWRHSKKGRRR